LHLDRRIGSYAIGLVALAVLIERDVEICRLLVRLVFGEIAVTRQPITPASKDTPDATADAASIEPHR
jgi:hypothetical protein